jgi:hypothetical protein
MIVAACHVGRGPVAVRGVAVGMVLHHIEHVVFRLVRVAAFGSFIIIENAVPTTTTAAAGGGDRRLGWVRLAWQTMLPLSVVGAVVCTIISIRGFGYYQAPHIDQREGE